ncbi:hypothetical protein ZWY2020_022221 [Hordeum vulgare]|nr:hypothetical protein ZWY2020_022221 [Hordeum vulgare]
MLHGCVVKVGLDLDMFVGSAMVDIYAKNGGLEEAIKVFDCIPNQNAVVYGAMIAGFARLGNDPCPEDDEFIANALLNLYSKARSVSDSLRCFHMTPRQDVVTWTSIITAFAHDENFEKALGLFLEFLSLGKEPDPFTLLSVMNACAAISMYRNIGDVEASKKTFEQITCLDIFSWSTMILRGEEEAIASRPRRLQPLTGEEGLHHHGMGTPPRMEGRG